MFDPILGSILTVAILVATPFAVGLAALMWYDVVTGELDVFPMALPVTALAALFVYWSIVLPPAVLRAWHQALA
jgi:hypothetical protein